jgi:hypothetical protein
VRRDGSSSCRLRALQLLQRLPLNEASTAAALSRVTDDNDNVRVALYHWLIVSPIGAHDALKVQQRVELVLHSLNNGVESAVFNLGAELVRRWSRELGQRNHSKGNVDALGVIRVLGNTSSEAATRVASVLVPSLRDADALPAFHTPPYERAELVLWRAIVDDAAARLDTKQLALELTRIRLSIAPLVASAASKSVRSLDAQDLTNFLSLAVSTHRYEQLLSC